MNEELVARRRREVRWAAWLIGIEEAQKCPDVEAMAAKIHHLQANKPDRLMSGDTNLLTGVTIR